MAAADKPKNPEHPLANILINVLIPVLALSYLSKDPEFQKSIGKTPQLWHIGPNKALIVALIFPIGYGIWYFVKTRKANFFSALGFLSVLLTGGLTIYLWNQDGTVKPHADILFGIKEASIPLMLGLAVIGSHYTSSPLLRTFLYTDSIFDIPKIEARVDEIGKQTDYRRVLWGATLLFAASFFLSMVLNFGLAVYFLHDLDHTAKNAREMFSERLGKVTGYGFLVIGVPILFFLFFTLQRLLKGLGRLTGMKDNDMMLPR